MVLIACEESQVICKAFRDIGIIAYSCDLKPTSGDYPQYHIQGDAITEAYSGKYKMLIGHPPCTYLSYAGTSKWNEKGRIKKRLDALEFFRLLWECPIPHICLENPKSVASPVIAKYSQSIQPFYFGDESLKTTWLWLKNLPLLVHNKNDNLFDYKTHTNKPSPIYINKSGKYLYYTDSIAGGKNGSLLRSKTFYGIAKAMADQWGNLLLNKSK